MRKQSRRFIVSNIIALVITVALLLFLFMFPKKYMKTMTDPIVIAAREAESAALSGDWPAVELRMQAIQLDFLKGKDVAKIFLNHEDIDELEALIGAAAKAAKVQNDAELLIHLERIISTSLFLAGIETFDIVDLF